MNVVGQYDAVSNVCVFCAKSNNTCSAASSMLPKTCKLAQSLSTVKHSSLQSGFHICPQPEAVLVLTNPDLQEALDQVKT